MSKAEIRGQKSEVSHDDIVYNNTIYRYYPGVGGNTPNIKNYTENGGWAGGKNDMPKEEVESLWAFMVENRDKRRTIEKRGCDLIIVDAVPSPRSLATRHSTQPTLAESASVLNAEYLRYKSFEHSAGESAMKIGLMLLISKQQLSHGQFGAFMRDHITFGERHAQRFMKFAAQVLNSLPDDQHKALMIAGPDADMSKIAADLFDGKSQMELFTEFGITQPKEKRKSLNASNVTLPPGETPEHYAALHTWTEIGETLRINGLDRQSWAHLNHQEREGLFDLIDAIHKPLKASLKEDR